MDVEKVVSERQVQVEFPLVTPGGQLMIVFTSHDTFCVMGRQYRLEVSVENSRYAVGSVTYKRNGDTWERGNDDLQVADPRHRQVALKMIENAVAAWIAANDFLIGDVCQEVARNGIALLNSLILQESSRLERMQQRRAELGKVWEWFHDMKRPAWKFQER